VLVGFATILGTAKAMTVYAFELANLMRIVVVIVLSVLFIKECLCAQVFVTQHALSLPIVVNLVLIASMGFVLRAQMPRVDNNVSGIHNAKMEVAFVPNVLEILAVMDQDKYVEQFVMVIVNVGLNVPDVLEIPDVMVRLIFVVPDVTETVNVVGLVLLVEAILVVTRPLLIINFCEVKAAASSSHKSKPHYLQSYQVWLCFLLLLLLILRQEGFHHELNELLLSLS